MTDSPADDLDKPLGLPKKAGEQRRVVVPWSKVLAGAVGALVLGLGVALAVVRNPLGGEPIAVASIDTSNAKRTGDDKPPAAQKLSASEPKGPTINIIDGMSGKAREVEIAPPSGEGADPRFAEKGKNGPLPVIAADGTRPLDAYSIAYRPKTPAEAARPRIAIVIGGLGISATGTQDAIAKMPANVSLAFAPYGSDLDAHAARARSSAHEVYLQIPMEPFDYPDNDPGPQSLLTSLTADRNIERLHWSMGRLSGYAGVMTYMGAKFTASEAALSPIMKEVAKRGLLFIDDGSSARSLADHAAALARAPFLRADITLDRVPTPAELDAQLAKLEQTAKEKGSAIGVGIALPVTLDRVAAWAKTLEKKGLVLVPVSALVARRDQG